MFNFENAMLDAPYDASRGFKRVFSRTMIALLLTSFSSNCHLSLEVENHSGYLVYWRFQEKQGSHGMVDPRVSHKSQYVLYNGHKGACNSFYLIVLSGCLHFVPWFLGDDVTSVNSAFVPSVSQLVTEKCHRRVGITERASWILTSGRALTSTNTEYFTYFLFFTYKFERFSVEKLENDATDFQVFFGFCRIS